MKRLNIKKIKKLVKIISLRYKPLKIILFGSLAWGKPNQDSDLDLFIIKETKENRYQRQLKVRRLIKGELPTDIFVYTPKEIENRLKLGDFFIEDVIKKGKVLYEAKK
jgi:predicted nucleotidyltransferase